MIGYWRFNLIRTTYFIVLIKNKSILNIKVPKGIIAKIDIESLNNNKTIKLNHKTLNINEIRDGLLELRNGDYQINF